MSEDVEVRTTVGAALAGCLVAVAFSAILGFQTFLYFQIFPGDRLRYKFLVGWIWILDAVHTIAVCASVWSYSITHFGNSDFTTQIVPTLAVTVASTAVTTLSVNIFYAWRIHKMSKANWWLTGPILLLAISRVGLAFVTTTEMILTKNFPAFAAGFNRVLTSALSVSAATDIIVSAARYYYLRNLKHGYSGTQEVVDAVVVFTINDGALTCAIAIATIIFLLHMPHNFIWLGFYFNIAKLFSNSVLATLNLRNWYRHRQRPMGIAMMRPQVLAAHTISSNPPATPSKRTAEEQRVQVFVNQEVDYNISVGGFGAEEDGRSAKSVGEI
ncbi:hypothetical protein MSAN_01269800 [Mycena sanguinolenta]|uniref:DUF6534 domain-containing protein n=1 Tax=Mycena sanguinolenta TaxID=230812 RepID=A0A8H7D249_9AGAR|nr:hypothetical protein MSAN_01269800 [Mycena sanguinolenta]